MASWRSVSRLCLECWSVPPVCVVWLTCWCCCSRRTTQAPMPRSGSISERRWIIQFCSYVLPHSHSATPTRSLRCDLAGAPLRLKLRAESLEVRNQNPELPILPVSPHCNDRKDIVSTSMSEAVKCEVFPCVHCKP